MLSAIKYFPLLLKLIKNDIKKKKLENRLYVHCNDSSKYTANSSLIGTHVFLEKCLSGCSVQRVPWDSDKSVTILLEVEISMTVGTISKLCGEYNYCVHFKIQNVPY